MLIRCATLNDVDALHALALKTGGGFTNLPPDREELARRVGISVASCAMDVTAPNGELYMLVLEINGDVVGTASIFSKLGTEWPFYSFRINKISQTSRELKKTLSSDVLHLVNDFDGCSEVGGLFLDPAFRQPGAGRLLARSRYFFIAQARARFAEKIVADLRGYCAEDGSWPFWEGLGRHFFDMPFEEADRYNSLTGNQFIADLMPKYPIYARLLPKSAQQAMGQPHRDGAAALKLLQEEGFRNQGYVDIFDGGPTMSADVADLRALRESALAPVQFRDTPGSDKILVATGSSAHFRAVLTTGRAQGDDVIVSNDVQTLLGVENDTVVRHGAA